MDIQTFVQESLDQIIQGVETAQKNNPLSKINPLPSKSYELSLAKIEFDIAVTLEKSVEAGGSGKGRLAIFAGVVKGSGEMGAKVETTETSATVNRIRFSVPVAFKTSGNNPAHAE